MARLNWRQILIHFFASCFFIFSFQTFSLLYDIQLSGILRLSNEAARVSFLKNSGKTTTEVMDFLFWTIASGTFGLTSAFIISLTIAFRRHWYWINSLITFVLTYILYISKLLKWTFEKIILLPGHFFDSPTLEFLIDGSILLLGGLSLFFMKRIIRFIEQTKIPSG